MGARPIAAARSLTGLAARPMLARYLLVSLCALCADTLLFLALSDRLLPPGGAACAGYLFGILVHWALSVRFVFHDRISGRANHAQRLSFALSALLGLGVTVGIVSLATQTGLPAAPAKAIAVIASFTLVYLVRKHVVFAAS
ncbi:GtrA family protein [Sphingobium sp. CCH11-B1]|jgi:putative flippase GtrA|uniref:GtrA family protein n=1 Tax=Sphingobium sp. CCH11-B1 TaxID=1768781 RepID=UPI00083799A4|nr:GtrA family protein [Sphingobium sp. CCH11-B1]MEA3389609.1 GtrA family protein [Pseudomonadota bacterium]